MNDVILLVLVVELIAIDQLNMESVVQCIRTSSNPQTHQQALLLLKTTAKLYPVCACLLYITGACWDGS